MDRNLSLVVSEDDVSKAIFDAALWFQQCSSRYDSPAEIWLVSVLEGGLYFANQLLREIMDKNLSAHKIVVRNMKASSYGNSEKSSGTVQIDAISSIFQECQDKVVILLDDVYDTGRTLLACRSYLSGFHPRALYTCTLVRKLHIPQFGRPDFAAITLPDQFLVGCGMGDGEKHRELTALYVKQPSVSSATSWGQTEQDLGVCQICEEAAATIVWNNDKCVCANCNAEAYEADKN